MDIIKKRPNNITIKCLTKQKIGEDPSITYERYELEEKTGKKEKSDSNRIITNT